MSQFHGRSYCEFAVEFLLVKVPSTDDECLYSSGDAAPPNHVVVDLKLVSCMKVSTIGCWRVQIAQRTDWGITLLFYLET